MGTFLIRRLAIVFPTLLFVSMLIFMLQGIAYQTVYTLLLPLSVLWASWVHPRPGKWYWNCVMAVTLAMVNTQDFKS